jgi:hypothetical protein
LAVAALEQQLTHEVLQEVIPYFLQLHQVVEVEGPHLVVIPLE